MVLVHPEPLVRVLERIRRIVQEGPKGVGGGPAGAADGAGSRSGDPTRAGRRDGESFTEP